MFPVPDKASLQPVELHGRAGDGAREPGRNPDADRLAAELRDAGISVFDPSPDRLVPGAPPYFLRQDTHWTPAWMETVADGLARFLIAVRRGGPASAAVLASAPAPGRWRTVAKTVARVGDITDMLGLPEGQTLFAPQTTTIHEVRDQTDKVFEPNLRADVLLLGDSFTNVFSLEQMGWGADAGFGAHLARALGRDVDILAQNDAGAYATRQLLWNALAGGDAVPGGGDRLKDKKVVIWEFASRELSVGNWKPIDWSRAHPTDGATDRREPSP